MRSLKGILLMVGVILLATSGTGAAQSVWQKIKKSAKDTAASTAQQGAQAAQTGVQQGAQQVQQQIPGSAPGQVNQMNPAQQPPCGSFPGGVANGAPANGYGAAQPGYDASGAAYGTAPAGYGNAPAGNYGNVQNAGYAGAGGPNYSSGSCGPQCFNAGPFAAAVTQTTLSQEGGYHIIRMNMQLRNLTNQPLMIAYHDGSSVLVDNFGSTYNIPGAFGTPVIQGMGIDRGNQTDSQFTLGPGQTGNVLVTMARARNNQSAVGTGYTYNFTIDELQAQNGADAALVRQYNLNLPSITPGASNVGLPSGGASPATNVAGGGRGKRGTASAAGAPVGAVAGVPAQGVMPNANGVPAAGTVPGQPGVVNATSRMVPGQAQPASIAAGGKGAAIGAVANPRAVGVPGQNPPGVVNAGGRIGVPPANARVAAPPAQNAVANAGLKTNAAAPARPAAAPAAKPNQAKPNAKTAQQPNPPTK
jgi:type II secretory pathway pseudopilin PulG